VPRLDWRFLLPAGQGAFDHLALLGGTATLAQRIVETGLAHRVSMTAPQASSAEAVIVLSGAGLPLAAAAQGLKPGGALYYEVDRRSAATVAASPGRLERQLRRADLTPTGVYWAAPDFADCRRYIPLDVPGAFQWYLFFVGGIAGTAFLLASLLHLFGRPADRPLVRLGYYVAFVGAVLSGLLLTVDLDRPERFWHMLIESNTGEPMFKSWVPMSVGSWGLLLFGLFSFLAALASLSEERERPALLQSAPIRFLRRRGPSVVIAVLGSILGLFLAGYTGVLLAVTNRPIWADSSLLGLLFLVSGASTGAAALILLAIWRRAGHPASLGWLAGFDRNMLILELLVLVVFLISLGSVARVFLSWWGVALLVGVVGIGILMPLAVDRRARDHAPRALIRSASLVLIGGFLLRVVVLLSSEQIQVLGAGVTGQ
jgi:formate-dependent nitrite reductase membrane component NrfD